MMRAAAAASLLLTLTLGPPRPGIGHIGPLRSSGGTGSSLPFDIRQSLDSSSKVLFDVIKPGFNPIPLPVLNRTQCVALINSKGAQDATGIVSCRLTANKWTGPAFVSFHNNDKVEASRNRELLVLIIGTKARKSLIHGTLKLAKESGTEPGPLVSSKTAMRDSDIKATVLTYNHQALEKLEPAALAGYLKTDRGTTRTLYANKADVRKVLSGRARPPQVAASYVTSVDSFFNMITPIGIIIHHSSALPTNNRVPTSERQVDEFHRKRGFAVACNGQIYHVAYQYFILPNGKVNEGRPENCQGAHAHGYNAYLGISLAGDFSSVDNPHGKKGEMRPTRAQLESLEKLCRRIMERYQIPPKNVLRHSDVARTRCPGDRFPYSAFMKELSTP